MTRFHVRLLVASVAALAVADAASAQVSFGFGPGGRPGVTIGSPNYGGFGNAAPGYGTGYNNFGSNYGYGGNYGYGNNWMGRQGYGYGNMAAPGGYYQQPGGYYQQPGTHYGTPSGYSQAPAYFSSPGSGFNSTPQANYYSVPTTQQGNVLQPAGYYGTMPQQGVVPAGGMMSQSGFGVAQAGAAMPMPGTTAMARVLAPEGAMVTLSGVSATTTSGVRQFTSPPLEPGKTYVYRAKATWTDESGRSQTREKAVDVKAGQQVTIDLTGGSGSSGGRSGQDEESDE